MHHSLSPLLVAASLTLSVSPGVAQDGPALPPPPPARAAPLSAEPIILTGADIKDLIGKRPSRVVAFAVRDKKWVQIPVQIDERVALPFAKIRGRRLRNDPKGTFYADPLGRTGADPNPRFDEDDELVLLQEDCGALALPSYPKGVSPRWRAEIRCLNQPADRAHAYLFESDGTLRPDANQPRMRYSYRPVSEEPYSTTRGPNEENSTITGPAYRLGFRDRWILDELRITTKGAPGVDILDLHKVQVIPGNCIRTTKTFSMGEGYALANIDGPIRSIRSVMGANSGPLTERTWVAYPRRLDIRSALRVHRLPSVWMFFDYSADALGMRYADNNNPKGCTIDGVPDDVKPGRLAWQFLTGKPGSLTIHYLLDTNIQTLVQTSLLDDARTPKWKQCTGDAHAYGVAGPLVRGIPTTDPTHGSSAKRLESTVTLYPGQPNAAQPAEVVRPPEPRVMVTFLRAQRR